MRKPMKLLLLFTMLTLVTCAYSLTTPKATTTALVQEKFIKPVNDAYAQQGSLFTPSLKIKLVAMHEAYFVISIPSETATPSVQNESLASISTDHITAKSNTPFY